MATVPPQTLTLAVDETRDHVLGRPEAHFTLVEYGSYACEHCHAAHEVVANLRDRFGDRMRYVYRHLPLTDRAMATRAAEVAEYASQTSGQFWQGHDALMRRDPEFDERELDEIASELGLPPREEWNEAAAEAARVRVRQDALSGLHSGARVTPTFFINGRRYEGAWDESALAEAMLGSLAHRLQTASLDFARWAPSTGLLLLVGTVIALILSNSGVGPAFESFWELPLGFQFGARTFELSLIDWVNHGLLSVFFLVVGLEIKREFTVGRLASQRAAILPVAAAFGGMTAPALIYLMLIGSGPLATGWGMTIATDTAFAIALIVLLGDRVPVDLRVFLTAAVIVDDLVAIAIVALFYASSFSPTYFAAAVLITGLLVAINRWRVYRALPYAALGILLWFCLHEAGVHATLAGVILALVAPTRPPPNLHALMAQAQTVIEAENRSSGDRSMRHGLSQPTLTALDAIHDRMESPASKVLRTVEPWSSYAVLPVFALANAGLVWSADIIQGRGRLILAIVLGLVIGKPTGILLGSWLAVRLGVAVKPEAYSWRQMAGAGMLAGIGFTMSLFIAGQAFQNEGDFNAAKVAIFIASLVAGTLGVLILWPRARRAEAEEGA
ncbi:MAG: Na+/H+ antiporter NhaA [Acidobacteria bacterium]|nr:MAG: Na+/H+ antiporter NhaA [Acidobacteriota bacterium]